MGAIRWGHGGRVPPLVQSGDIICHVPTFSLQVSQCLGFTPTCPPHILQENCAHAYKCMNTFKKWFGEVYNSKNSFIRTGISLNQGYKRLEEGVHSHA